MSQASPSATINDIATASVAAYAGESPPVMGGQWTTISQSAINTQMGNVNFASDMTLAGFSAQAYVNIATGEIIIANRGTVDNIKNIISVGLTQRELS